jgi:non-heme chloroperoxidase
MNTITTKDHQGAPHGIPTTHKDRLDADLLAFIKG